MTASTPLSNRPADQPLRICFLGESVAAGYLYAPHLTPAQLLQTQLGWADADKTYEVIDMSRTNETIRGLLAKVRQAVAQQPDIFIIFAGNNWNLLETTAVSPHIPGLAAKQAVAATVRDNGLLGLVEVAARQRLQKGAAALAEIHILAQTIDATVVIVIPEVNLGDWWSHQPPVWLAGQATARWYELYFAAQQQLAARAWETAVNTAQKMLALDGSTCPTTYRLLAEAYMGLEMWQAAREACVAEVDSDQYALLAFMSAPRATPLEQGLLRPSARQYGFTVVDLPHIFAAYLGKGLPDRRLFLDYCHLTAEGMQVSMAAVTAVLLRLQGHSDDRTAWQSLLPQLPKPPQTAAVDATAQFGAAIHTAHRLISDKQPLLRHWCRAALHSSIDMAQTMLDFVRARLQAAPIILTGTQQRNLQRDIPLGIQQGWHYDYVDRAMIEAIEATLVEAGVITTTAFRQSLLAASPLPTELAHPAFYHWEPLARFYRDVLPAAELEERPFYRSPWPISSFCLLSNGRQFQQLSLTARAPHPHAQALLWLNGRYVAAFAVNAQWQTHSLRLPTAWLHEGINRLDIHWPFQAVLGALEGERMIETAVLRLEKGLEAHFHPIFGELFSLTFSQ